MKLLVALVSLILVFAAVTRIPYKKAHHRDITWLIGIAASVGLYLLGTWAGCYDGWVSHRIGKPGACSSHGGLVTDMNAVGFWILVTAGVLIFGWILYLDRVKYGKKK